MSYQSIITIQPGKRGGKPCIRNMRITLYDVLKWMTGRKTRQEILNDYPELIMADIQACLKYSTNSN